MEIIKLYAPYELHGGLLAVVVVVVVDVM